MNMRNIDLLPGYEDIGQRVLYGSRDFLQKALKLVRPQRQGVENWWIFSRPGSIKTLEVKNKTDPYCSSSKRRMQKTKTENLPIIFTLYTQVFCFRLLRLSFTVVRISLTVYIFLT